MTESELGTGGRGSGAQILRWVIGLTVLGLSVWLLVRGLNWQATVATLLSAEYGWVILGVVAILGTFVTRGLRWQALLYQDKVGLMSAVTAILIGQVVNTGLPVARSGDVARAVWVSQREMVGASQAIGTIVLEKVWDLLALCVAGVILLLAWPLPVWFSQSTWAMILTVAIGIGALYLGLYWQRPLLRWAATLLQRLPGKAGRVLLPQLEGVVSALDAARQPQTSANAGLWTFGTWVFGALANWAVMRAFGVQSWPAALFLEATLMLGGAVVPTPGRIGVFEGIAVVSLTQFGVDASAALAIGVVLHLVVLAPALIAAALLSVITASPGLLGWLGRIGRE
ncbi:MAG: flippase-like domain-containing protein [Anaerolineae bacterium]|nr:flippase-like domain-containing protein [Anaerolineae bacterium]